MDALLQPALDPVPFLGRDDARNQIEGERPLGAGRVAVDVEGDAELDEDALGGLLAAFELAITERLDRVEQELRLGAWLRRRVEDLVVEPAGVVPVTRISSLRCGGAEAPPYDPVVGRGSALPSRYPESLVSLEVPPAAGT